MNARIKRGGVWIRPTFNFSDKGPVYEYEDVSAQMLESIRNLLESCQMLECDVALSIKNQEVLLKEIRNLLRKKSSPTKRKAAR